MIYYEVLSICKRSFKMDKFLLSNDSNYSKNNSAKNTKKRKYRKCDDSYLDIGLTAIEINGDERPQCVICMKVLAPECMLPSKLKRHLETVHPTDAMLENLVSILIEN